MIDKKKLQKILIGLKQSTEQEKQNLLKELRNDIDLMDRNIATQLSERIKLIFLIGQIKKDLNIQTYSSRREQEILKNVTSISNETVLQKSIKKIYVKIIEESRLIQKSDIDLSFLFKDKNKSGVNH
ncbi:MAG: chorismate mutase [Ignavibacteriales bacterium]|nr:chorismate mutase [Ignavibacteriales bacterium]